MALTKIDDRGLKTPIDLLDNEKIRFGTGNDLEIYHDGDDSYLINTTGTLMHKSNVHHFRSQTNENMAKFAQNGAVELYYDNVKKFETTSAGVSVTGTFTASSTVNSGGHFKTNSDWNGFYCGASDDLQIYHDGSNSYISDQGTGELRLLADVFHVKNAANDETLILGGQNGAVSLYHDNNKRFETTAGGTIITGTLDTTGTITGGGHIKTGSDSGYFLAGASNDLQIYHNGSDNYINYSNGNLVFKNGTESDANCTQFDSNGDLYVPDNGQIYFGGSADLKIYHDGSNSFTINNTGNYLIKSGSDVYIRTATNEDAIHCNANGAVEIYYDDDKKFETISGGTRLRESQQAGTSGDNTSPWSLTTAGSRGWNWQDISSKTTFSIVNNSQYSVVYLNKITAGGISDNRWIDFRWDGAQVGTLDYVSNDVVITQQSDYRLKENIVGITDGIAKVKQLNPVKFNFKADAKGKDPSILNEGFLAHELQAVIPQAASGVKDATKVDEEGDTVPDYQGIWMPKIIPMLTAALKEAITKIETLETKVAALEAA